MKININEFRAALVLSQLPVRIVVEMGRPYGDPLKRVWLLYALPTINGRRSPRTGTLAAAVSLVEGYGLDHKLDWEGDIEMYFNQFDDPDHILQPGASL